MAKFTTEANQVSHGDLAFAAADGVVDIPDDHVALFADLVGTVLTPVKDEEPATDEGAPRRKRTGGS